MEAYVGQRSVLMRGHTGKIFTTKRSRVKKLFRFLPVCENLFLLTANNPHGFGQAHNVMRIWFPGKEYAVVQAPQGQS